MKVAFALWRSMLFALLLAGVQVTNLPALAYIEEYLPLSLSGNNPVVGQKQILQEISPGQKSQIPVAIKLFNDADGLSISGQTRNGQPWSVRTENVGLGGSMYQLDLDKNGVNDYVVLSETGACGIAPPTRLTLLLFNKEGLPRAFELVGYFRGDSKSGVEDIFSIDSRGEQVIVSQELIYAKIGKKDRNYWRWHLYKASNCLLGDHVATIKGTRFPNFISYTNKQNHQPSKLSNWLEQRTKSQHRKVIEIPVQLGN